MPGRDPDRPGPHGTIATGTVAGRTAVNTPREPAATTTGPDPTNERTATVTSPDTTAEQRHPHGQVHTRVVDDHILVITVDRVEKKNAMTPKMGGEIAEALTRLDDEGDLFVGVLCFAGDHTTAGLDMPLFFGDGGVETGQRSDAVDPYGLGRRPTKPVVTAIQGITFTAGIELALAGDITVAASDVRICQLEPKRGLAALGGGTFRWVERAGWGNAMYHLLRADEVDAAEAFRIGLVQEVVEPGTQIDRAIGVAREIAACSPVAVRHTLANARLAVTDGPDAAAAAIPAMAAEIMASDDFAEGVASFLERRDARFTGR